MIVNHGYVCDYGWDLLAFFWYDVCTICRKIYHFSGCHTGSLTSEVRLLVAMSKVNMKVEISLSGSRTQLSRVSVR